MDSCLNTLPLPAQPLCAYGNREVRAFSYPVTLPAFGTLSSLSIHLSSFWNAWALSIHVFSLGHTQQTLPPPPLPSWPKGEIPWLVD